MPLSWNEIKTRAIAFAKDWAGAGDERAEAQTFWNEFFAVFGLTRKRIASFEHAVKKHGGGQGFVDLFWPGMLLVEHKSRGKALQPAHDQALDYFPGLKERDLPRYVLVSDFARLRITDLETGDEGEFALADLHKHLKRFAFIAGYQTQVIRPQDPVNLHAAERMGKLHDALEASGYAGHALEVLLVRLLFCLFADDTGIFQPAQAFRGWIEERTADDGSDLGPQLAMLFQVLDTPDGRRSKSLDEQLAAFPYVNGALFAENLPLASFDRTMRERLLDACAIDWSAISPAIFGALFQSIMKAEERRNLGAHYTSEENILKLVKPLFLDELWAEFHKVKGNRNRLFEFHKKLRGLTFLDPACGCGNFLVITYRELRLLELEVLRAAYGSGAQRTLDVHQLIAVNVDQFHGIEIEEFPAQVAQVALWLADHQMNLRVSEEFGQYYARIPLTTTPHIVHGNALTTDWASVIAPERCSYVLGNPPFVGKHYRTPTQRADLALAIGDGRIAADVDYVAGWYFKAARYMVGTRIAAAFVSTNSITQGEQVPMLWPALLENHGVKIHFAHRTFQWSNEGRGVAAVHCVIVGFALWEAESVVLYDYVSPRAEPHALTGDNISPYLALTPTVIVHKRRTALAAVPTMRCGSKPSDGGHLVLTEAERDALLREEPGAAEFVRSYVGSEEFINGGLRFCLWLPHASPALLRRMPAVMRRVEAVRRFRLDSTAAPTRAAAATPTRFFFDGQPPQAYIAMPEVSSERRNYVPVGLLPATTIASNKLYLLPSEDRWLLGLLQSAMHMAWMRTVAGRLESRYQYSATMVYNTFPWPDAPTPVQRSAVEASANTVLDTRAQFPGSTLADLYDPLTMPPALLKAHQKLDAAVDAAYGRKPGAFKTDAERVAFLFERYQQLTSLLPAATASRRGRRGTVARRI
jgi:hypothetical protein